MKTLIVIACLGLMLFAAGVQAGEFSLHELALLVNNLSKTTTIRLMTDSGMSAVCAVGATKEAPNPSITVYPMSQPLQTRLRDIGEGKVIGAIVTNVHITYPLLAVLAADVMAGPGAYLLFYQDYPYGEKSTTLDPTVTLLAASVDKHGKTEYRRALPLRATRQSPTELDFKGRGPEISVSFPPADLVTKDNPARRATIKLTWMEEQDKFFTYRFQLDVDDHGKGFEGGIRSSRRDHPTLPLDKP